MAEDMSREEIKKYIIEFFRTTERTQVNEVITALKQAKAKARSIQQREGQGRYSGTIGPLSEEEEVVALELLHYFTISGVLAPVFDRHNVGWPWLKLTAHGKEVIAQEEPSPYDVEGYLTSLKASIPALDEVVAAYVSEGLRCLEYYCVFAAAFLLGGASQRLIQLLGSSMREALKEIEHREKFQQKLDKRDISKVFDSIKGKLGSLKQQLPEELTRDFDYHIEGVFQFIRLTRNEVGHPRDNLPEVPYTAVYADYRHFATYAGKIYALINHFSANPQSL